MRFEAGEIAPMHISDDEQMADFGTKWLPSAKLRASLCYRVQLIRRAWHTATYCGVPRMACPASIQ